MKQINLVVEDKPGILSDLSFILGKARINIESIYVGVVGGKAVINLTVKDDKKALELLHANGYQPLEFDVLLLKLKDEPGELSKVSKLMAENGINIEAIHVLCKGEGFVVDALKVDKIAKAEKLLKPYLKMED
jgi:hypothetical protein